MKKALILFCLIFIIIIQCFSQTIIINGKVSDGKLTWDHFAGKVDKESSFTAYTSYIFKPKFGKVEFVGDSVIINGFVVILEFDHKKSWAKIDKISDALLIHEQGHFNIGILTINEILEKVKQERFSKNNFNERFQSIINEVSKKYREMTISYDKETNHSKNIEEQNKWNIFFSEQLEKYGKTSQI